MKLLQKLLLVITTVRKESYFVENLPKLKIKPKKMYSKIKEGSLSSLV